MAIDRNPSMPSPFIDPAKYGPKAFVAESDVQFDEAAHPDPGQEKRRHASFEVIDDPEPFESLPELPEHDKFLSFCAACREVNESRVAAQLARMVAAGVVTEKSNWPTDKRHEVCRMATEKCHQETSIRHLWPLLCFLRGKALGNHKVEVQLFISWVILGELAEIVIRKRWEG
jgi:hypothetical protein